MARGAAGRVLGAAAALALGLGVATAARAGEDEGDLRDTVRRQAERIEDLERRLRDLEGRPGAEPGALDEAVRRYLEREPVHEEEYALGLVRRPASSRFRAGGYLSVLYRSPDARARVPSFEGLRVVPQFSFDVSPGIEFATEIEFERGGVAEEFLDDSEVLVEYAEARFSVSEALVPKAGILLLPFLRYNLHHDDPIWNLQDRPFTARRVFKTAIQQPGVGVEGNVAAADGLSLNYDLALTDGMDDEVGNRGFEDARQGFGSDNNHDKTLWARVGAVPRLPFLDAADLGVSYATGRLDAAEKVRMVGYGFDGKLTRGPIDVIFEWTRFGYDRPESQPVATFPRQACGAFVEADWRLVRGLPKSANGIVGPSSTLTLAVRYEWNNLNARVTGASVEDDARAVTVGLAFRPTPKTVIRIERKEERSSSRDPAASHLGQWVFSLATYF